MSLVINLLDHLTDEKLVIGGTRDVIVIVVGKGHDDTISNPGQTIEFHFALIPLGKV